MDASLLGFSGLGEVYNLHPVFVHFPIALLPVSFLFYAIGWLRASQSAFFAGRACLGLATAGLALSVITGLRAEGGIPHNDVIHRIMHTHEIVGFTVLGLSIVLLTWCSLRREHRPPAAPAFVAVLGVTALLALQNADLGGRMVFVEGAGVKAAAIPVTADSPAVPPPAEPPKHDHSSHKHSHKH
ncbi:MAG: hypothetical protein A3G34_00850 [Candidatus Lindowbacteria bacterium RIFCSPLOWO2_12_FULL_62_27]|nr:MAG: hypothetical protein A3G34_00850 [Candidatus Lindowbacteria bacterium RIFCSPLOWO2_12_FULL_62_27]OGH58146.1 MAG: hypothetical protein A3I06_00695 [Candidatus Lindowbacteria bacterium RIFCSPLOWO2_02_FULL_62_12]